MNEDIKRLVEAAKDVLALPVAVRELSILNRGIGTSTENAAWLRLSQALASLTTKETEHG